MKLQGLGIRLNIAYIGAGTTFISKFASYSYWLDGNNSIDGAKIMVLELWVNNRRIIRCFQNSASKLLFCEICSWPNKDKKQIIMSDFCDEGVTLPAGTVKDVYNFILERFDQEAENMARPGRIRNILKKIRKYEDLGFAGGIDQFC